MKTIAGIIIALFLILSSLLVFAQELPATPAVISVEFVGTTIPQLDYRFNRDANRWEFRGFGEWLPVSDMGAPFNAQHQRLATNLIDVSEKSGYKLFDDLSAGRLSFGGEGADILGLPPPENAQGEGIAPITPGVPSAAISGCISPRCQQIDQVWIKISGLLSGISSEAKNNIYDPRAGWIRSQEEPEQTPPRSDTPIDVDILSNSQVQKDIQDGLYTAEFALKVRDIAAGLGFNPLHVMAIMRFESARFDPSIRNPSSGATGLIQFTSSTARELGTTTDYLAAMSQLEQLDFVKKYFELQKSRYTSFRSHNFGDVAMAVFYPQGIGKSDDTVLFSEGSQAYTLNRGLDNNPNNGQVTRREYLLRASPAALLYGVPAFTSN